MNQLKDFESTEGEAIDDLDMKSGDSSSESFKNLDVEIMIDDIDASPKKLKVRQRVLNEKVNQHISNTIINLDIIKRDHDDLNNFSETLVLLEEYNSQKRLPQ